MLAFYINGHACNFKGFKDSYQAGKLKQVVQLCCLCLKRYSHKNNIGPLSLYTLMDVPFSLLFY